MVPVSASLSILDWQQHLVKKAGKRAHMAVEYIDLLREHVDAIKKLDENWS